MRKLIATTFFLLAAATSALAGVDSINAGTLYWENDNFGFGRKSDRFYTNGAKLSVTLSDTPNWATQFRLRRFCPRFCRDGKQYSEAVSIVFGQNFYTPEGIVDPLPQLDDRPWAGSLYGGIGETITSTDLKKQHYLELQVGVLGPGAGGQATQKYIHNDLGFSKNDPLGWHHQQRKNEVTVGLLYRNSRIVGSSEYFDLVPEFGGLLGTFQTFVNAGATARLGFNISGFPTGLITPTAAPTAVAAASSVSKPAVWEAYVFAGVDGRFMPFNATLDGPLLVDGPKAPGPKRFVNDVRVGLSVRRKWLRLTYSVVDRSKEFSVPAGNLARQRFGSYALTFEPFNEFR